MSSICRDGRLSPTYTNYEYKQLGFGFVWGQSIAVQLTSTLIEFNKYPTGRVEAGVADFMFLIWRHQPTSSSQYPADVVVLSVRLCRLELS